MLILREELRKYLSAPRGSLYTGDSVRRLIMKLEPQKTITVGDVVTKKFIEYRGEAPSVSFIDFKSERLRREELDREFREKFDFIIEVRNEQGTIAREFILENLSEILTLDYNDRVLVIVHGEEDLLPFVTPYIKSVRPLYVLYGQPKEGVVLLYMYGVFEQLIMNIQSYMSV